MGEAQGKKVDPSALPAQAIEAQPPFGQIKPRGGKVASRAEQHPPEKTWRTSVGPHKTFGSAGEGKETLAYRKAAYGVEATENCGRTTNHRVQVCRRSRR
jgi:hypothetical protein